MRGKNCDWKYLPFIYCAERWGSFVSFDLHLFNYWEVCARASGIMKFHSCCKRRQQGTQQPGLSYSQIKAAPARRWKKHPDDMPWRSSRLWGPDQRSMDQHIPWGLSFFLPIQRAGQVRAQSRPCVPCLSQVSTHTPNAKSQLKVNAAHLCTLSLGSAHCPQCTPHTWFYLCWTFQPQPQAGPFLILTCTAQEDGLHPKEKTGDGKLDKGWPSQAAHDMGVGTWPLGLPAGADGNHGNEGGQHLGETLPVVIDSINPP